MNSQSGSSPAEVYGGIVMDAHDDDDGGAKTTRGNPGTPATQTMSTSSSLSTSSSTSSSASATHTNAAIQSSQDLVFFSFYSIFAASMCLYLS
jgi:hypothetical protein